MSSGGFFKGWESLRNMAGKVSKKSGQIDEFMQALNFLGTARKDKGAMQNVISYLAKVHREQVKKAGAKNSSSTTIPNNSKTEPGDNMYDLLNSPGMHQIVKEVLNSKRRKKKK